MTETRVQDRWQRISQLSAVMGLVAWWPVVGWCLPDSFGELWGHAILMFAALVIVPLALAALSRQIGWAESSPIAMLAVCMQAPAAWCLAWSLLQPQGLIAAAACLPWLALMGLLALSGLIRIWNHHQRAASEVGIAAGLIYSAIGGVWTLCDRAGFRPLDFEPVIVILTAIHFHFAGLALPILIGFASRSQPGPVLRCLEWTVVLAVPAVAVGITCSQLRWHPLIETLAAEFMALAGIGTALIYLGRAINSDDPFWRRGCWLSMSALLIFGMLLAGLYGLRNAIDVTWMDIRWMRAWHGTANMLACLCGLIGWSFGSPRPCLRSAYGNSTHTSVPSTLVGKLG